MLTRIQATFNGIEKGKAVFELQDGQKFQIPKQDLEPLPEEGSLFVVQVMPEKEANLNQNELAQTLLNQLLNNP